MPESSKTYDVFLSFNSKDREAVTYIACYLKNEARLRPWFDEWEMVAGDSVVDKVYQGLEAVPVYAVFLGRQGEGPWQSPEIRNAVHNCVNDPQRRIIPVFLPEAPENPVLPPFLKSYKWVDFRGKALDDPEALRQLVAGIRQAAQLPPLAPPPPDPLRDAYLHWLLSDACKVSLSGIDPKAATNKEAETCLNLGAIYTALLTFGANYDEQALGDVNKRAEMLRDLERQRRHLSALAQLNTHAHLVLLGDPGSGKSTFVNFVTMCLAGEYVRDPMLNLALLTAPLPVEDDKDEEETPQTWEHTALLPVRVILRDFALEGLPAPGKSANVKHLWDFLTARLHEATLGDFAPRLQHILRDQGGLLLLDGLDEVPEAHARRTQIKQVVEEFSRVYHRCRVLVTSRTYAYQQQDWRLRDFEETVLAPLYARADSSVCDALVRPYRPAARHTA